MKNKIFFFIFTLLVSIAALRPASARAEDAPLWFCKGIEGWQIDAMTQFQDELPCGDNTGNYVIDTQDGTFIYYDWSGAKSGVGENSATIWFQPYEPNVPQFFCGGFDAWTVPLNANLPDWPVCGEGSGEYVLDVTGGVVRTPDWGQAREYLWGKEGTLYFERMEQPVADGFCEGGVPWQIPGNSLLPEFPVCEENSGTYFVDNENGLSETQSWDSARFMIGDNGGTFWYEKSIPMVSVSAPDGFCSGGIPWQIEMNNILPDGDVCDFGSGLYVVDKAGSLERTDSWFSAKSSMDQSEGTLWFEPTEQI